MALTAVEESPPLGMDLTSGEINTIIWATGYHPDYSWLDLPVFDRKGRTRHDGGIIEDAPGAYLLSNQFLCRRKSALIDGIGDDTRDLSAHLAAYLDGRGETMREVENWAPPKISKRRLCASKTRCVPGRALVT